MNNTEPDTCQKCFRKILAPGERTPTQWISVCRCDRPYSPNAQFSIDVCAVCKRRVAVNATNKVSRPDVCSCEQPDAKKVPAYLKPNESDGITFDLKEAGIAYDSFPSDKYAPIGILGDGARATVILARDKQRGTKVAVKCFKRLSPALQSTFDSEARKNKQLTHTSIAKLIDFGFHNGKAPYMVSEYKEGFNVEQCLALYGIPTFDVAVKILIGVCEALLYAQKQSVFHKDVRPGNIIFLDDLNSEPSVAVCDFALPKIKMSEELTEACDAMYMSGDEARNMDFNEKSEVYSLGCVGYALLTGRAPFIDGTAKEIKNSHALKLPPRISSLNFDAKRPKDLEEVIERCLEKDPTQRFDSIAKFMERLEVYPRRVQMQIAAAAAARKRKKLMLIAGALLAAALVCGVGYAVIGPH